MNKELNKSYGGKRHWLILFHYTFPLYLLCRPVSGAAKDAHQHQKFIMDFTKNAEKHQICLWPTTITDILVSGYCRFCCDSVIVTDIETLICGFLSVQTASKEIYYYIIFQHMMQTANCVAVHDDKMVKHFCYAEYRNYITAYVSNNENDGRYFAIFPELEIHINGNKFEIHMKRLIAVYSNIHTKLYDESVNDIDKFESNSHCFVFGGRRCLNFIPCKDIYFIDYKSFDELIIPTNSQYNKLKTALELYGDMKRIANGFVEGIPNTLETIKVTNRAYSDLFVFELKK